MPIFCELGRLQQIIQLMTLYIYIYIHTHTLLYHTDRPRFFHGTGQDEESRFSRDGVSLAVGAFNGECASRAKFQVVQPQRGFGAFLARPLRSRSLEIYKYF